MPERRAPHRWPHVGQWLASLKPHTRRAQQASTGDAKKFRRNLAEASVEIARVTDEVELIMFAGALSNIPAHHRMALASDFRHDPSHASRRFSVNRNLPDTLIGRTFTSVSVLYRKARQTPKLDASSKRMLHLLLSSTPGIDSLQFGRYHVEVKFGDAFEPQEVWLPFLFALREACFWTGQTVELIVRGPLGQHDSDILSEALEERPDEFASDTYRFTLQPRVH